MSKTMKFDETDKVMVFKKKLIKRNRFDSFASRKGNLKEHLQKRKLVRPRRRISKHFQLNPYVKFHGHAHIGLKRYTCKTCGNLLSPKSLLQNPPSSSHIVKKDYMCDNCATILISNLPLNADQVLQCSVCSELFTTDKALKFHSRVHKKGYKCSMCCRAFAAEISLKAHMEKHLDWKPHQCDVCSKRFFHRSSLEEHSHKHAGERHLRCEVCGKICLYYGGLMLHMNGHGTSVSIGFGSNQDTQNQQKERPESSCIVT